MFALHVRGVACWAFSEQVVELIWDGLVVLGVAALASGATWGLRGEPAAGQPLRWRLRRRHDPLIVASALALLNLLYAAFCSVQLEYLFGGGHALPAGLSPAEYARQGFAELSVVTALNAVVVLLALSLADRGRGGRTMTMRLMISVLIGLSFVIAVSAFGRLSLYEAAYGYTYLRVFARTMLLFMGASLTLLLARTWWSRFPFGRAFLLTALFGYVGLSYVGVDGFIARKNIARFEESGRLDFAYLSGLAWEATPELTSLLDAADPALRQRVREHLVARRDALVSSPSWLTWNWSRSRADRALERALSGPAGPSPS